VFKFQFNNWNLNTQTPTIYRKKRRATYNNWNLNTQTPTIKRGNKEAVNQRRTDHTMVKKKDKKEKQ
jgi:hypothetical protein